MLIAPAVLAAIISAVGALGGGMAASKKPPDPPTPPGAGGMGMGTGDQMTGGSSKAALGAGQKVADAYPTGPAASPGGVDTSGMRMNPQILELIKKMGGM